MTKEKVKEPTRVENERNFGVARKMPGNEKIGRDSEGSQRLWEKWLIRLLRGRGRKRGVGRREPCSADQLERSELRGEVAMLREVSRVVSWRWTEEGGALAIAGRECI